MIRKIVDNHFKNKIMSHDPNDVTFTIPRVYLNQLNKRSNSSTYYQLSRGEALKSI